MKVNGFKKPVDCPNCEESTVVMIFLPNPFEDGGTVPNDCPKCGHKNAFMQEVSA